MTEEIRGRSLAVEQQLLNRDIVIEARSIAAGGMVASHGARVQPALERMLSRSLITRRQYDAGDRLYQSHALGIAGARNFEAGGCTAYQPAGYADSQLNAAHDFAHAKIALGDRLFPLVYAVAVMDVSVETYCQQQQPKMDRRGGMALLRYALDVLGDHYRL